ncbi:MAG: hypothetical protein ACXVEF_05020 [Polyangiales bacterium]
MADPHRNNGVNGAMAEQKESSVLFSLKELMSIEENRIREEDDAKKRKAEAEVQAKADAERRAREEEEARLRAEEERRRQDEMRRKMEEAQIEAAKAAEIEKRKLEDQHRLQMEALAKQQAHEKEIHVIQSQKRKGIHPGIMAGIGVALLGALFAVIFFVSIKPASDAKDAVKKAEQFAAADEPSQWDEADRQLAIARDKDPTNKDIQGVADKVKGKRDKLKKAEDDKRAELEATLKKLQGDLKEANDAVANAKTDAEKAAAQEKLDKAKKQMAAAPAAAAPAAKKVCPPGVPLCN